MALFRRGLPRRAVLGAFLGFLYGALTMLSGGTTGSTAVLLSGVGWILLSISLLFARSFAYYAWVAWALVWIASRGIVAFRAPNAGTIVDVAVPLVSLALVSSSGYVAAIAPADDG